MLKLFTFSLLVCATFLILMTTTSTVKASGDQNHLLGWLPSKPSCKGSIAECVGEEEEEFQMDSEISRRILATNQYISYGALRGNTVPCSRRGASYYNCKPGAQANPYSRGCSAITRCRS